MQLDTPGIAGAIWQRLWRPSTLVFIGAGLLAADRLRWLPSAWTDANFLTVCALATLSLGLARLLVRGRTRRREVQVLVLPLSSQPLLEPDTRNRVLMFVLFMLALVLIPAVFS